MKKYISYFIMVLLLGFTFNITMLNAQEPEEEEEEGEEYYEEDEYYEDDEEEGYEVEVLQYWQEKYEVELKDVLFEDVVEAIIQAVSEQNACAVIPSTPRINDEGLQKQTIKSDYCIFAMGDTTYRDMSRYSVLSSKETRDHTCLPFIPGAKWKNGRVAYRFLVKEIDEETITIMLKNAEISGKDEIVTSKVHFWESNGLWETITINRIKEILEVE